MNAAGHGAIHGEAAREAAVARSGVLARTGDADLASIVSETARAYGAPVAGLSIITGRWQVVLAALGTHIVRTSRAASFCQVTIQRPGEPLVVPDAAGDARFADLSTVTGSPGIRFYAGFSVVDQNGYALGALCVADRRPRPDPFDPATLVAGAHRVERLLNFPGGRL